MSVSASITKSTSNNTGGGGSSGGNDSGCMRTSSKKVRRFTTSEYIPQSEESGEEEPQGRYNSLVCIDSITDNILAVDILTQPITIYSTPAPRTTRISTSTSTHGSNNKTKSRSAGPCSPNNSSSESSTFSIATTEIPREITGLRKSLIPTSTTHTSGIPIRKFGGLGFNYRSQSAFSLLQPQTAHSGHQNHYQSKSRIAMPCPAKKQNKWDAVMSKIAETKNKAINIRDVKSRVFSAMRVSAPPLPPTKIPNVNPGIDNTKCLSTDEAMTLKNNINNNRKLLNQLVGNSNNKSRHRHLLLHENDHFSSQSSTLSVSDSSSLDEHHLRGNSRIVPPRLQTQPRVKKDVLVKSRRQMSDLSSASDYSTHHQAGDHQPPPRRKPRATATRVAAAKSHSNLAAIPTLISAERNNCITNGHNAVTKAKRYTAPPPVSANFASTRPPLSLARNVVPTTNGSGNLKSHPHKPLRDRNRMAPIGKTITMDTSNANGIGARVNGHSGPLEDLISDDTNFSNEGDVTIIPVKVNDKSDSSTQVCITSLFGNGRLIEEMTMSDDSDVTTSTYNNSRRNTNQHHQSQNAVILENNSLKEEINKMSLMIQKLQGQVQLLSSNYEKQKKQIGSNKSDLAATNSRFVAMTLVAQQCDLQRFLIAGRLSTFQDLFTLKEKEKIANIKAELCRKYQKDYNSHKEQIASLTKNYESEIAELEEYHEDRLTRAKGNNDVIMADLRRIHEEDMQRLEANYREEIEVLKVRHEEHMADQIKKTPGDILHKEIDSLQVVIEIRNQEIKDLRHELLEAQTKIETLTQTNEQNKALSAKVEDLEAQLEKTRRDKNKIMEKFNTMETSMSQVVTENDRLHLYTEELNWRIETLKSDDHVSQTMSKSAIEFGTTYSSD